MKRWTLVLFLLLLPFTMAPRMALTPDAPVLDVVLNVSRIDVESGDRVNVVGKVKNVSDSVVESPQAQIALASEGVLVDITRLSSDCSADEKPTLVTCDIRPLRPGQQATFRFAMVLTLDGGRPGTLDLSAEGLEASFGADRRSVTITVTDPDARS